jgi:uncharacterized protein YqjF (DUF2071 family)
MAHEIRVKEERGSYVSIAYKWFRKGKWHAIEVQADSNSALPDPESKEAFFMERYWGYTLRRDGSTFEYLFAHPPWPVKQASAGRLTTCHPYEAFGFHGSTDHFSKPHSVFIAPGSEVRLFLPHPVR